MSSSPASLSFSYFIVVSLLLTVFYCTNSRGLISDRADGREKTLERMTRILRHFSALLVKDYLATTRN